MKKQNMIKRQFISKWNPIDVGIALAHLYVANEESFKFFRADHITDLPGYSYIGSVNL